MERREYVVRGSEAIEEVEEGDRRVDASDREGGGVPYAEM